MTARFSFPTDIRLGAGVRAQLPEVLGSLGASRPLIVTDSGVAALPFCGALDAALSADGRFTVATYSDFAGNPVESHVTAGAAACRAHDADAIVALGGGAALDVAKAIALMAHHPGALFDYEDGKPDGRPVDQPIPAIVALPTTAGTGSEVGRSTVISDDVTKAKKIMFSPRLLPAVVLADPELLVGLPPGVTASTGMDALTHNVEAFLAIGWHPMCDGMALEGVRLIAGSLARSVADGADLDARRDMLMASLMGAVAFQKGLGVTHSLAHALSTVCDLHHGLANSLMIRHAMAFNAVAVPERLTRLAAAAGLDAPSPDAFIAWLGQLQAALGLPLTLGAVGVSSAHLDALVDVAIADACHPFNPRPCTRDDLRAMYVAAL